MVYNKQQFLNRVRLESCENAKGVEIMRTHGIFLVTLFQRSSCLVDRSAVLLVEYRADGVLSLGRGSSELKELRLEGDRRVQLHEGGREFVPRRDGSGGE